MEQQNIKSMRVQTRVRIKLTDNENSATEPVIAGPSGVGSAEAEPASEKDPGGKRCVLLGLQKLD